MGGKPNDDFTLNRKFWSERSIFFSSPSHMGPMLRLRYPFPTSGSRAPDLPFLPLSPGPLPIPLLQMHPGGAAMRGADPSGAGGGRSGEPAAGGGTAGRRPGEALRRRVGSGRRGGTRP